MSFADDIEAVADHARQRLRQVARMREQGTAAAAMRWREAPARRDRTRSADSNSAQSNPAQSDEAQTDEEQRQRDREQGIYRRRY